METMAIESLLAALWELDGYITKTRIPYKVSRGYSDIDVIGLSGNAIRIGECKARFDSKTVMVVSDETKDFYDDWLREWGTFALRLEDFWKTGYEWLPNREEVQSLDLWFCANIHFQHPDIGNKAANDFLEAIYDGVPHGLKTKTETRVVSTYEVVMRIFEKMEEDIGEYDWHRRYGNPILDTLREMLRYLKCERTMCGERTVDADEIQIKSMERLQQVFAHGALQSGNTTED